MAIELLHSAQRKAADLVDVDPDYAREQMRQWSQTRVRHLGEISVGDTLIPVYRGRSGSNGAEDGIACGGIRAIHTTEPGSMVSELSEEMDFKLLINGKPEITIDGKKHTLMGGKGLIPLDLNLYPLAEQRNIMAQYARAMEEAGISSYEHNKVAGDLNTNHLMGAYVSALDKEQDPYYLAAATGKPLELGGLDVRKEATGLGVFAATIAALDQHDKESTTAALQGVGAVGLYYLASANQHKRLDDGRPRVAVTVISEKDGTISTDHPHGFQLNDEAIKKLTNPSFKGSKLEVIKNAQENPDEVTFLSDPDGFYYLPAECRVPAAFGNSINERKVDGMLSDEAGTRLVVEGANNPTTTTADERLREAGVVVIPDVIANAGGVEVSLAEMARNVQEKNRALRPHEYGALMSRETYEDTVRRELVRNAKRKVKENSEAMESLRTSNPRVAAIAVGMARVGILRFKY